MAYFSQNTIEMVKEMYSFWRENGSARISCTASFCASARSALSALRAQDSAWYGVRLTVAPLAEEECFVDERGNSVCMMLTMEKAVGKTPGSRAKMLRTAGMLEEVAGRGPIAMPAKTAAEIEAHVKQMKPVLMPSHIWKLWEALGEVNPEEKTLIALRKVFPGIADDKIRGYIARSLEKYNAEEDDVLLNTAIAYWEPKLAELLDDPTIVMN